MAAKAERDLTYPEVVNRLKDIDDELGRLEAKAEEAPLSEEDERYFRDLVDEFHERDTDRKSIERERALASVRKSDILNRYKSGKGVERVAVEEMDDDPFGEPGSIERKRGFKDPFDLGEMRTFNRTAADIGAELHSRALAAVEEMQGANQSRRERFTAVLEEFDTEDGRLARFALVTGSPTYLRAFTRLARGAHEASLSPDEQMAIQQVKDTSRALSLTDAEGGYLVPFQLDPAVIITSDGSLNEIRQAARQVVATGDVWNGVSAGAVQWRWAGEATQASDNSPTFDQPTVGVHKADGFVPISLEALQDAQNVTQEVGRLLVFGKDSLESEAFISGDGNGQPQGIINGLTGGAQVVETATASTFAEEDVYTLDGSLPARFRRRASWLGNRLVYNEVRQFGEGDLWQDSLQDDNPGSVLGRRAYEAEEMSGTIADGEDVLVFGDFEHYVIADRIGFTVEFIPHLFGANQRPTGQRGWYAYYRVGADFSHQGAFRLLTVASGS